MKSQYDKWEKFYNKLSMVFHGVIALSMIPFAWAFLETQKDFPEPPLFENELSRILWWVILGSCLAVLLISYNYSKNLLIKARQQYDIGSKLKSYVEERLKDYMLLEVASFLAFLGLYITKDHVFSIMYVAILLIFSMKRPTYHKIIKELHLNDKEVQEWIEQEE